MESDPRFLPVREVAARLRHLPFPPTHADWLYVGYFRHPRCLFDRCNLGVLLGALEQQLGRDAFSLGMVVEKDQPLGTYVLLRPDTPRAVAIAGPLMDLHDDGQHMSDEVYWEEADKFVQRLWQGMAMPDRIELVARCNLPPSIALEETVAQDGDIYGLWVALYQDVTL